MARKISEKAKQTLSRKWRNFLVGTKCVFSLTVINAVIISTRECEGPSSRLVRSELVSSGVCVKQCRRFLLYVSMPTIFAQKSLWICWERCLCWRGIANAAAVSGLVGFVVSCFTVAANLRKILDTSDCRNVVFALVCSSLHLNMRQWKSAATTRCDAEIVTIIDMSIVLVICSAKLTTTLNTESNPDLNPLFLCHIEMLTIFICT